MSHQLFEDEEGMPWSDVFSVEPHEGEEFKNREPLARRTHPVTSHMAAEDITASGARNMHKRVLLKWLRTQKEPLTSREISHASGIPHPSVHKRLPDLKRDGFVRQGNMRYCSIGKRLCVTWMAI